MELLDKHAAELSEHFDSVQIIATKLLPSGKTVLYASGQGNYFARQGSLTKFLEAESQYNLSKKIGDELLCEEDDDDNNYLSK